MICKPNYATICKINYAMCIFIGFNDSLKYSIITVLGIEFS